MDDDNRPFGRWLVGRTATREAVVTVNNTSETDAREVQSLDSVFLGLVGTILEPRAGQWS